MKILSPSFLFLLYVFLFFLGGMGVGFVMILNPILFVLSLSLLVWGVFFATKYEEEETS